MPFAVFGQTQNATEGDSFTSKQTYKNYLHQDIEIDAVLDTLGHTIAINQKVVYHNYSKDTLKTIWFHNWPNSYANKTTPLAIRFEEDYKRIFHFAKPEERGSTDLQNISNAKSETLAWEKPDAIDDILKIDLRKPLLPDSSTIINLQYTVKLPDSRFTGNGYTRNNNFYLRSWYIIPAVYDGEWEVYSDKDLIDFYAPLCDYKVNFTIPEYYTLSSGLVHTKTEALADTKKVFLEGNNLRDLQIYIQKHPDFYRLPTDKFTIKTNISEPSLDTETKLQIGNRITNFLDSLIGPLPIKNILVSDIDQRKSPIYGLNQLPEKLRPFTNRFQYEMELLKTTTNAVLDRVLIINPREEKWVTDGILIYGLMTYVDRYYPEMKLGGSFSKIFGLKWFHAVNLDFNDQYYLGYKNMARRFIDQPLDMARDSLLKFNYSISNMYKAGLGLKYLEDYLEDDVVSKSIKNFVNEWQFKQSSAQDFKTILETHAQKDIDWFFEDYVATNKKIDYKIADVTDRGDSLMVTLRNRRNNTMPVSLYALKEDSIVNKIWVKGFLNDTTLVLSKNNANRLVLDYNRTIPEVRRSNNYKNLDGVFNKPLQLKLFKDVEDPSKNQTFFMPVLEFNNIYDGVTVGGKIYNKTIIKKPFIYKLTPTYGFKSKALLGSFLFTLTQQINDFGWYAFNAGISGSRTSYARDLYANGLAPSVSLFYRKKDLRSNLFQSINIRNVSIYRDRDPDIPLNTPNYSVLNARYYFSDSNFSNSFIFRGNLEISKRFSKISTTAFYRKLFLSNRQISFRLYAGTFLNNNTQADNGYFDFALDRPSDYLFDYNYIGRSESTGLASQQYIVAEGGFKSILPTRYANQWITTLNGTVSIWNWIHAYGDIGLLKNEGFTPYFAYDSGIKLSLVTDYFELYFPVASNNGFEIGQPNYDRKIRFLVTLNFKTLIGLFTRRWY
ncbi:hypothetical protein GCM10022260_26520 [Gaetbulibacter aestuarii]